MSSDYFTILQLTSPVTTDQLDLAYRRSRDRYIRLTSTGPLRYYRNDLLSAVDRAYWGLKHPAPMNLNRPLSLLAIKVAGSDSVSDKAPVRAGIKTAALPRSQTAHRKNAEYEQILTEQTGNDRRKQAQIEDEFCRQVIYRLEGDIIRHDARMELFALARQWHIPPFRANLLMAQIVEAVRRNKLYGEACPAFMATKEYGRKTTERKSKKPGLKDVLIISAVSMLLALLVDLVIIYNILPD